MRRVDAFAYELDCLLSDKLLTEAERHEISRDVDDLLAAAAIGNPDVNPLPVVADEWHIEAFEDAATLILRRRFPAWAKP